MRAIFGKHAKHTASICLKRAKEVTYLNTLQDALVLRESGRPRSAKPGLRGMMNNIDNTSPRCPLKNIHQMLVWWMTEKREEYLKYENELNINSQEAGLPGTPEHVRRETGQKIILVRWMSTNVDILYSTSLHQRRGWLQRRNIQG